MSVVIAIAVIVLLAAGVHGFVRTARFGTSFIARGFPVTRVDLASALMTGADGGEAARDRPSEVVYL